MCYATDTTAVITFERYVPYRAHMAERPHRLLELDLLRITAALAVVLFHYTFSGPTYGYLSIKFPGLDQVTRFGYLGVDLFFMISGFVVLMTAWQRTAREFLISRIVRLYPAYWLAVTLTALVTVWLGGSLFQVTLPKYLANLTMFQSLANVRNVDVVYWTLWAELRFYAIVLVLTLIGITRERVIAVLWGWLAACALLESGALPAVVHRYADLVVQTYYAHYFIAGMALYLVYRRQGARWQLAAILALSLANAMLRAAQFTEQLDHQYQTYFHPMAAVGVVVVIFAALTAVAMGWTRRLARRWFVVAGAITYPLYLIHAHIGFMVLKQLDDRINKWVLVAAVALAMCGFAYLIQIGIERPVAPVLKRSLYRLTNRRNTRQPAAATSGPGAL